MDFNEALRQFAIKAVNIKPLLQNEEQTKNSLILPFFKILGYDVFDPTEFIPEYVADVGIKKGEKVDYVIIKDCTPVVIIEAKWCGADLDIHTGQLYRYFSVTTAKFGILTNGIDYKFYTDLEAQHKMDLSPFLEFNITDIKDDDIAEIKKFCKDVFNVDEVAASASELRYLKLIKSYFNTQLQKPTDEFTFNILGTTVNNTEQNGFLQRLESVKPELRDSYSLMTISFVPSNPIIRPVKVLIQGIISVESKTSLVYKNVLMSILSKFPPCPSRFTLSMIYCSRSSSI